MTEVKFVVMGSTGVGKSAVTMRFISGEFVEQYDPTIEDCYTKQIEQNNKQYAVEVLDTAGTEMFDAMRELYIKNGHGFVLVYSITSKISFSEVKTLYDNIVKIKATSLVPLVLVGNKSDLEQTDRVISREEGKSIAASWRCPFLETSAKLNLNINTVFTELINEVNRVKSELQASGKMNPSSEQTTDKPTTKKRRHAKIASKCIML